MKPFHPLPEKMRFTMVIAIALVAAATAGACGSTSEVENSRSDGVTITPGDATVTPTPSAATPAGTVVVITPVPTLPGEPPTPDESQLTPEPTPLPSDPFTLVEETDAGQPFTASELVQRFELIVTGYVVDILPAQWTTPDGHRPENPWVSAPSEHIIITPVIIELDRPPIFASSNSHDTFDPSSNRIVVAQFGGTVSFTNGVDAMATDRWSQQYQIGDHVLVALTTTRFGRPALPPTPAGPGWTAGQRYEIHQDGTAVIEGETGLVTITLDALITDIEEASHDIVTGTQTSPSHEPTATSFIPGANHTPTSTP